MLCELVKIKPNTLLLIRFSQVENIKSITLFNSIVNLLGRMDVPLTDCKIGSYDGQGLISGTVGAAFTIGQKGHLF